MSGSRHQDLGIQTVRGLALLLVVAGHVIGFSPDDGLRVSDGSFWRKLYDVLKPVRMPLFCTISGYVYAMRAVHPASQFTQFGIGKLKRLGIPFMVVTTIYFILLGIKEGVPFTPLALLNAYLFGSNHLWFLQAIMWIFLLVFALDKFSLMQKLRDYLIVLALALLSAMIPYPYVQPLNVGGALLLLPFFLLGLGIYRFDALLPARYLGPVVVVALVALYLVDFAAGSPWLRNGTLAFDIYAIVLGFCTSYSFLTCRWHTPLLAWLGAYAFEGYLFHLFGTAGSRMVLNRFNVDNLTVLFVVGAVAGLLVPICMAIVIKRVRALHFLSYWLFGTKIRPVPAVPAEVVRS